MENKKQLHFYTSIFQDFGVLRDSGILSNERVDEVINFLAPNQFVPTKLEGGRVIADWVTHEPTGKVFANWEINQNTHHLFQSILVEFLTDDEISLLNARANSIYTRKKDKERFERAEKISYADYEGDWIYSDDFGYNEGYFQSLDDLKEYCAESELEMPDYVWPCVCQKIVNVSLDDISDRFYGSAYEDFEADDVNGKEEFEAAIEKFNNLNKDLVSYSSSHKKVIILTPEEKSLD